MYLSYFGLKNKPFAQVPQIHCLFPASTTIEALENLRFGLLTQHSISLLTAPPGLGKSLILQAMAEELNNTHKPIYMPTTGIPGRAAFLQAILFELKRPYAHLGEQELRLSLIAAARDLQQTRLGIVLLLDELHLADDEVLMEIRTLTTFAELGRPLFSVIAAGQVELEDRLTHPKHAPFNQRIGGHVLLNSLSRQEAAKYIRHQIEWAEGTVETIFTADAIELITQVSAGVPRNINLICDQSLMLAYANGDSLVDRELVETTLQEMSKIQTHSNLQWSPVQPNSETQFEMSENRATEKSIINSLSSTIDQETLGEFVSYEVGFGVKQAPNMETLRQPLTSASTATIVHELAHLEPVAKTQSVSKKAHVVNLSPEISEFTLNDRYTLLDYERQLRLQLNPVDATKQTALKGNIALLSLSRETAVETNLQETFILSQPTFSDFTDPSSSSKGMLENIRGETAPVQYDVVMPDEINTPLPTTLTEIPAIDLPVFNHIKSVVIEEQAESTNLRLDNPAPIKKSRSFKNLFSKLRSQQ